MADTFEKRIRESKKRRKREMKAERKRLRKDGVIGQDNSNFFFPGEQGRESVNPYEKEPPEPKPGAEGEDEAGAEGGAKEDARAKARPKATPDPRIPRLTPRPPSLS